jgi:hypothetical protein
MRTTAGPINFVDFADNYIWCSRTDQKHTSLGDGVLSSKILHAKDGTAIYVSTALAPVALDRNIVENEITQLSKELNERPAKIEWSSKESGSPTAVLVVWGHVFLEEVDVGQDTKNITADEIETDAGVYAGLLIDTLGDLASTLCESRPPNLQDQWGTRLPLLGQLRSKRSRPPPLCCCERLTACNKGICSKATASFVARPIAREQ